MRTFLKIAFIFALLAFVHLSLTKRPTTYDEEYEDEFLVEHLKDGDGIHFPEHYKFVRMKYKGFIPATGQVFDSTDHRQGYLQFQYRPNNHFITSMIIIPCIREAFKRMSTGEKIVVICPAGYAWAHTGYHEGNKLLVKPGETVAYELEMIDAQFDPFNFKLVKQGIKDMPLKHYDLVSYKIWVWAEDDRDHIIIHAHSGNAHLQGLSFDNTETVCFTEAMRKLTVGGIAEVYCPWQYMRGGVQFPYQHINLETNLGVRIQLVSAKRIVIH